MNSGWDTDGDGSPGGITEELRILAERNAERGPSEAGGVSRPPPKASEEERRLNLVFNYLRGSGDYMKKAAFASDVLNGEYGIKNEILARLMMGHNEFREVIKDRRDIVPPLLELLWHNDIDVRVNVAKVLAERGDGRALFDMYGGLEEKEYWARYEFSVALAKIARRLTDAEAVAEIRAFMEDRAERLEGIAPALMLVKMHLDRLRRRSPDEDKKSVPPALRHPPMAVIRDAAGRPDGTARIVVGRVERPDSTLRVVAGRVERPDTTVKIIKPR